MGIIPCDDPKSPDCPCIACEARRLDAALTAAQARVEELERAIVWAVKHGALFNGGRPEISYIKGGGGKNCGLVLYQDCDGTPASILAAVEKAMQS